MVRALRYVEREELWVEEKRDAKLRGSTFAILQCHRGRLWDSSQHRQIEKKKSGDNNRSVKYHHFSRVFCFRLGVTNCQVNPLSFFMMTGE
jgi:hypothetical protein